MKITKSQLKQIIKEELGKVLNEGDLPKYRGLPDDRKDIARAAVQKHFKKIPDYQIDSTTISQIMHDAWFYADPNKSIGKDILNILVQKYPEEVKVIGKSPKYSGLKTHPHWTPLSNGVREEVRNLKYAIKNLPEDEKNKQAIMNRLRKDWVGYAKELGVALGQSESY